MYPKIVVDYKKLVENTKIMADKCHDKGISVMAVTKSVCGWDVVRDAYIDGGVDYLADSRVENFMYDTTLEKVLLRLPQKSQYPEVVKYCDISLNSSLKTIQELDEECIKQGKTHKVILMFDIGDLREGIYYKESYEELVADILKLENIILEGIGTNLTCYGGVIPTKETLNKLEEIGRNIEDKFDVSLKIKSFGNSSSIYLLDKEEEFSYFNNLRLGEVLVLGRETAYGELVPNMHSNIFKLQAQLIEVYEKPSMPEGELGMNAFGEKVEFEDKGMMKRGILAIGRQDVNYEDLTIIDSNVDIVGSSSDHMIVDLTKTDYKVGDIVEFNLTYGSLLMLTTSKYVYRGVENGKEN